MAGYKAVELKFSSLEDLLNTDSQAQPPEFLSQWFAFQTSSQAMLMLVAQGPYLETPAAELDVRSPVFGFRS